MSMKNVGKNHMLKTRSVKKTSSSAGNRQRAAARRAELLEKMRQRIEEQRKD